ncbi:MAG: tRNA (guanosine(46)-N7)-methyltransferase TrmB [Deltaproteobacteria bacterium]|nr:tRNA (guanosine(46)-N7)-methyltransferase TrmB [Deltaproteobacteria bacterium]
MKARYISLQSLLPWPQGRRPIDWKNCFERKASLEVEIGFGNGEHLVRLAQKCPNRNFVGIEASWESVQRALRRTAQARIFNVRLILVDARTAFDRLFKEKSIDRIYALYPCPWPKKRHVKHRLFSNAFLKVLNSRLVKNGEIQIVTDQKPYVEWLKEQIQKTGLQMKWGSAPARFDTKYERKWQTQGQQDFFEIILRKEKHIPIPTKEDISLKTYRLKKFNSERFQPKEVRGKITIQFKEFLYDPQRKKGMIRAVVVEENLLQNLWIEIAPEAKGWRIRPASGCSMIPTLGVQRALDAIYQAATVP